MQARAPQSVVIIVGTHLDQIEVSQQRQLAQRYARLICQSFTDRQDLPFRWPKISSIHFVGLVSPGRRARDINVDELRNCIYDTALNMELPKGKSSVNYYIV